MNEFRIANIPTIVWQLQLHRLTLQEGVYPFRYFLLPMRIPDWQVFDLKARVFEQVTKEFA